MENIKTVPEILSRLGIEQLNEMQLAAHKAMAEDKNVLLLSPTGSGKTLAFLLPVLQLLQPDRKTVQCLILTPSRELALQIEQVWKKMSTGYKVNVCYGGHSKLVEMQNLSTPPALLIGTPGRIMDHIQRKSFDFNDVEILVLDEFDKSLDLGFHEQMSFIIRCLGKLQKRVLVSATSSIEIPKFAGANHPTTLNFLPEDEVKEGLTLKLIISEDKDKIDTLFNLICSLDSEAALIFCNHRVAVERTCELLKERGIVATFYHGGMDQDDRERSLVQFRNGSINYLITTDLAARGLDIPEMKHVIHYHPSATEDEFIHRNGRTARMHASGTAYLILHKDEKRPVYIEETIEVMEVPTNNPLPKLPEFTTLYINGGKKNKLNKVDIVGFLAQKGKLEKDEIGLIEVKDFSSFVAVKESNLKSLLANIKDEKMKGKKYKIEVASTKIVVKDNAERRR
jgi:superfamily II DNA/RNA helicase